MIVTPVHFVPIWWALPLSHACICVYMQMCVHGYMYVYICVHICMYVCMQVCACACVYRCGYVYVCVCICVCVCLCACMCMCILSHLRTTAVALPWSGTAAPHCGSEEAGCTPLKPWDSALRDQKLTLGGALAYFSLTLAPTSQQWTSQHPDFLIALHPRHCSAALPALSLTVERAKAGYFS